MPVNKDSTDVPPLLHGQPIGAAEIHRLDQRIDSEKELTRTEVRRLDERIDAAGIAVEAALAAAKEAVTKAEVAAEKRFESVNEFRASLADQQRTLLPRAEGELRFNGLEQKIGTLANAAQADARFTSIEQKIEALTNVTEARNAAKSGKSELWAWIVGVLGAISLLASLLPRLLANKPP